MVERDIERLKKGDPGAQDKLYRQYKVMVLKTIEEFSISFNDAEDLVQDVFMSIYEKIQSYKYSVKQLPYWINTKARETVKKWLKSCERKRVAEFFFQNNLRFHDRKWKFFQQIQFVLSRDEWLVLVLFIFYKKSVKEISAFIFLDTENVSRIYNNSLNVLRRKFLK